MGSVSGSSPRSNRSQRRSPRHGGARSESTRPFPREVAHSPIAIFESRAASCSAVKAQASPETVALADQTLSIPMRAPVESLNVATAAAIIAYEAQRQRHGGAR